MRNKCICINNKRESLEGFNLWQTYEYETGMYSFEQGPEEYKADEYKVFYIYFDEEQWTMLFEEQFDTHFIDTAIYRENRIKEILK